MTEPVGNALAMLRATAQRLDGNDADFDALVERARRCSFVLLGEATHGTAEFYRMRADITRRLIVEAGFDAVAVEGDWPDVHRVHRYVVGESDDADATDALGDFERFPRWMWRNDEVVRFVAWMRARNDSEAPNARAGFYGLDLYSMYRSAEAVIEYLETVDDEQARLARAQYAALDHAGAPERYGYEATHGLRADCRDAVRSRLVELVRRGPAYLAGDGRAAEAAHFFAAQNAHVVANAEAYYREMFADRSTSWNRRDLHMADTLSALRAHLRNVGRAGRIVVWAHNSHLGDARATEMSRMGEWNVGQLVREREGEAAFSVGFTTYTGTVTAAREWGGPAERRVMLPALPDSFEDLFRRSRLGAFYLPLDAAASEGLRERRLERAIGVLYHPETEFASHYFAAELPLQFGAVFHLDETQAVEPLDDPASHELHAA